MTTEMADAVQDVISAGIALRDRLEAGEPLHLEDERQSLTRRLRFLDVPARNAAGEAALDFSEGGSPAERQELTRATVCYALTCWLDEWLARYSPLGSSWRERSLESELFASDFGPAKFWDEARYAETREDTDALEVIHLCVMLGFRGNRAEAADQVDTWTKRVRARLANAHAEWTMPAGLEAAQREARLGDPASMHRLVFSLLLTAALAAPIAAALLWRF
ncbi:MAG: DotU family type IV/VI secretion system protein [Planctomycetes bacterium]|nr:DotU family type IV/VI secretion system protein [Planctomycetota bacterium]